ncbi:MAG: PAS domain S-box protein [Halarchaeum sp.]
MIDAVALLCVGGPRWSASITRELTRESDLFDVRTARSAEGALDVLAEGGIDCVLSAYGLPARTGVEFLERVRDAYPELPFVIFTEEGSERIASEAISAGVSDYFVKDASESQYSSLATRLAALVETYRESRIVETAEANWREAKQRVNDVYYMFTGDWSELLYVNSAYEDVWGGPISELRADPSAFLDYVHPDDRAVAVESMRRLSNGESTDIEYRVRSPDGGTRWVRGVSEPIRNADGEVVRVTGAVRDVSELKERERRFRAVFEESLDAIVIANDDGEYVSVNDAACELFGLPEDELLGRTVAEFAAPGVDVETAWETFQSAGHDVGTFRLQRPDGTVRLVEYEATTDILPGEHLSILRDVTERERRRRELAESEARYETLIEDVLDTSAIGTFILDAEFEIVWANRAVEEYFGVERADVLGRDAREVVRTELKRKFAEPERFAERVLGAYADNTYTAQFECKIRDERDGSWRWLRHWSQPIRSGLYEGGRIEHYTDFTEAKTRERQLQVLERVLRHNLQNKMNVVIGSAETIAAGSGGAGEHARRIVRAGEDLLSLSAKEKRIVELVRGGYERRSVDIAARVRDVVAAVRADVPEADIVTRIPAEARVVAVSDIERGVAEVVENAVRHGEGTTHIEVSVVAGADRVTVTVRDDNPPIPERETAVLRGDVDIDQLAHSRGLGLWLAYWLVATSGGDLSFESDADGNEVRIALPTSASR